MCIENIGADQLRGSLFSHIQKVGFLITRLNLSAAIPIKKSMKGSCMLSSIPFICSSFVQSS